MSCLICSLFVRVGRAEAKLRSNVEFLLLMSFGMLGARMRRLSGEPEERDRRFGRIFVQIEEDEASRPRRSTRYVAGRGVRSLTMSWAKRRRSFAGQAGKCTGRMPRHESARKDVASCEKPRGAASKPRSGDIRMGKPGGSDPVTALRCGANPGN